MHKPARFSSCRKYTIPLCIVALLLLGLLPAPAQSGILSLIAPQKAEQPAQPLLPAAAISIATMLDAQLVERLNLLESPAKGYGLIITTPVNVNNLEETTPLSRQMGEELAGWFVQAGYNVQEIRKGRTVLFAPGKGELLLTRRTNLLGAANVRSSIIMASTYTTTTRHVRFNVRLIHAATNDVLAMASHTIPLNGELLLLAQSEQESTTSHSRVRNIGIAPAIRTRLP